MFEQGHGKLDLLRAYHELNTYKPQARCVHNCGYCYRIAGIFRGYKCSRFSRIEPVPRKFIPTKIYNSTCSVLWIRG